MSRIQWSVDPELQYVLVGEFLNIKIELGEENKIKELLEAELKKTFKDPENIEEDGPVIQGMNSVDPMFKYSFLSKDRTILVKVGFEDKLIKRIVGYRRN